VRKEQNIIGIVGVMALVNERRKDWPACQELQKVVDKLKEELGNMPVPRTLPMAKGELAKAEAELKKALSKQPA